MRTGLARASWVVSVLLALATIALLVLSGDDTEGETVGFDFLLAVALLVYPTVGVLIASRRPENAIGWLFCAVGIPLGVSTSAWVPRRSQAAKFRCSMRCLTSFTTPCGSSYSISCSTL